MALVKCPECNKDVSDEAKACPYCGRPLQPASAKKAANATRNGCLGLLVLVGFVIIVGLLTDNSPPPQAVQSQAVQMPWYVAHIGADACVPIGDIDLDRMRRSYYGGGGLTSPDEFAAALRRRGVVIVEDRMQTSNNLVTYRIGGDAVRIVFIRGKGACQFVMDHLEK
jgi:hypothetical protein